MSKFYLKHKYKIKKYTQPFVNRRQPKNLKT